MELTQQLQYQLWAETTFINLLKSISESEWSKEIPILNKSLKSIYVHKMDIMWFWFSLCKTKSLKLLDEPPNFNIMTKDLFLQNFMNLFHEMMDFAQVNDENLILDLNWITKPYEITIHELIYNILNHHTYHRGQIAILLRILGLNIPETDYNPFMFELNHLYE